MSSRKPNGYWTKQRSAEAANLYGTRRGFKLGSPSAYGASLRRGWLDEVCGHMVSTRKPPGFWSYEQVAKEAGKYSTPTDFMRGSGSAYVTARSNGWLSEVCDHMERGKKPAGYWCKERVLEAARAHDSRAEFHRVSSTAYSKAISNGWLEEACAHMAQTKRPNGHWTQKAVLAVARQCESRTEFKQKAGSAYAAALRNKWLDHACEHMTQKQKPNGYWTKTRVATDAAMYRTRAEFRNGSARAFSAAGRNRWMDDVCAHMEQVNKPSGYWGKEKTQVEALKYKTRGAFQLGSGGAYHAARKRGWLEDICSHMTSPMRPHGYWTLERCAAEARQFETRTEFQKGSPQAYKAAYGKGYLDEVCAHMKLAIKPNGYWSKDNILSEARRYDTRIAFKKTCPSAYKAAMSNGWLEEVCEHMDRLLKPDGYWTQDRVSQEASQYETRSDFMRGSSGAYGVAAENGWLEAVCSHMRFGDYGFNPGKRGMLYVAQHKLKHGRIRVNVGITNNSFKERYSKSDLETVLRVEVIEGEGHTIAALERSILERFAKCLDPKGLGLEKKVGTKECLKADYDSVLSFALKKAGAYGRGDGANGRRTGGRA